MARSQALKIEKLEHQLAGHRKARFGSKSECVNGGTKTCHWGGAKVGHFEVMGALANALSK
mgnify:CR=1 FL=1